LERFSDLNSLVFDEELDFDLPHAEFLHARLNYTFAEIAVEDNKSSVVRSSILLGACVECSLLFRLSAFEVANVLDVAWHYAV